MISFSDLPKPSFVIKKTKLPLEPYNKKVLYKGRDTAKMRFPLNQPNSYIDEAFGFIIKWNALLNGLATAEDESLLSFVFDKGGCMSCFDAINVKIGGGDGGTKNINLLASLMKDIETSPEYASNTGLLMEGLTAGAQGVTLTYEIGAGAVGPPVVPGVVDDSKASVEFCLQIPFTAISNTHQNIPLFSKSNIEVELVFAEANVVGSFMYHLGTPDGSVKPDILNDLITYSNVRMETSIISVSDNVQRGIDSIYDGVFILNSTSWSHADALIPTGSKKIQEIIPIAVKSMKRVFVIHRDNTKIIGASHQITEGITTDPLSLGHHINPSIANYHFTLDDVKYPTQPVDGSKGSYYELLRADDQSGKHHENSVNVGSGSSADLTLNKEPQTQPWDLGMASSGSPHAVGYNIGSYVSSQF